jgi:hypothetical protein
LTCEVASVSASTLISGKYTVPQLAVYAGRDLKESLPKSLEPSSRAVSLECWKREIMLTAAKQIGHRNEWISFVNAKVGGFARSGPRNALLLALNH